MRQGESEIWNLNDKSRFEISGAGGRDTYAGISLILQVDINFIQSWRSGLADAYSARSKFKKENHTISNKTLI